MKKRKDKPSKGVLPFFFSFIPCRSKMRGRSSIDPLERRTTHTWRLKGRSSPEFRRGKEGKSDFETTLLEGED